MSKLNAKVAVTLKYWAAGVVLLIVAWISYFVLLTFAQRAVALGFVAVVVYLIAGPYILGRAVMWVVAIEIFSEKLKQPQTAK